MFYINHIDKQNNQVGVADSDDGIIDLITKQTLNEYRSQGIDILDWNRAKAVITNSMNRNCNYCLWRKLQRNCSESELIEYLEKYSVYSIAALLNTTCLCLNLDKGCKIFNYSETSNYIIFTVYLSDNSLLIVRITSDYYVKVERLDGFWHFKTYPSCAGNVYGRLLRGNNIDTSGIVADEPYLLLYSNDKTKLILISHISFSINSALVKNLQQ